MSPIETREPGARWLRCDLHVHTPFDPTKDFGENVGAALADTTRLAAIAERFVSACRAADGGRGLDLVALTDHNSIVGYRRLRPFFDSIAQRALETGETMPAILPGVEVSVGGERPLHFLVVFAAETKPEHIENLIRHLFGEREPFDHRAGTPQATGGSVDEFLKKLHGFCRPSSGERNIEFVVVPAHADGASGVAKESGTYSFSVASNIWEEMKGHLRQWAVSRRDWNGFQTKRPFDELPQAFQELLLRWAAARRGEDWDALSHPQKARYREQRHWALLECSDPAKYDEIGRRFSWLKMEIPDVEGIRLALLDPESRLRRMAEGPPRRDHPRIERLEIAGTDFFEKIEIPFNSCLTTIIGGRGSGKSTVIEYLRFAMDRGRPEDFPGDGGGELRENFEALVSTKPRRDHGETGGTLLPDYLLGVDVLVAGRRYRIERGQNGLSVVRDPGSASAEVVSLDVRSLITPRILSQRQISRIARDPAAQRSELDALLDPDELRRFEDERAQIGERLVSFQGARRRLETKRTTLPARTTELQKVIDQITFLEGSGGREILATFDAYEREARWLREALASAAGLASRLDELSAETKDVTHRLGGLPPGTPNEIWLQEVALLVEATSAQVAEAVQERAESVRDVAAKLRAEQDARWQPRYAEARSAYDRLRGELEARGVDFTQHEKLLQQRAALQREIAELERIGDDMARTEGAIAQARTELVLLHERRRELRAEQAGVLEKADADVRLNVLGFRDRKDFESRREEWFSGAGLQERDWTSLVEHVFEPASSAPERIGALVGALRQDLAHAIERGRPPEVNASATAALVASRGGQLTGHFSRALERGSRIRLDEMERFLPDDAVEAKVRSADGAFKPITTGSVGEKSTAILSLLLSTGNQPLIVDQPEDDLDNRYVYEVVVKLLRRRKFSRQIVIATHNANIPVNGDAELIVAVGAKQQVGAISTLGSIDRPDVKDQVSLIMEGSAEAFRLRRERYGY